MTTKTISALAATNTVDANTVAPVVYSGTTYKATLTTLGAFITTNAVTLSASGNITGGNVLGGANVNATTHTGTTVSVTGNVTGGNVITSAAISAASVSASGNITGGNVIVGNLVFSTDTISSQDGTITIDPAAVGVTGLVIIQGNLQVNGNTTTINSNVVSTNDLTYNLANNAVNSAAANGGGIEVGPIGSPYITWLYNSTANVFTSSGGISAVGNITGGNILGGANVNATILTGTTVSVSGNITGGNLIISGSISDTGQLDITTTASNSNIVLTPNGTGNVNIGSNIIPTSSNATANIGSATASFNTVFAKATSAQYADLAEKYTADAEYTPGTVLSFGGSQEVTLSLIDADHRVAGVVSTNSAYIMNAGLTSEHVATVALTGRVPCSVTGTVRKGDSMVSAGNGAARAEANPAVSTVIGKALENFDGESGVIEVVVGRV
jgi:hypothetical protein